MAGGLGRNLFVRNGAGYATDPVSLNRIPAARAVKVGRHYYDSKTLRALFKVNPRATNPLTRQPFPAAVYQKYGPAPVRRQTRPGTLPMYPAMRSAQRRIWRMAAYLGQQFLHDVRRMPPARRSRASIEAMDVLDDGDLERRGYDLQLGPGSVVLVNTAGDVVEVSHRVPFDGRLDLLFSPDDGDEGGQVLEMVMRV